MAISLPEFCGLFALKHQEGSWGEEAGGQYEHCDDSVRTQQPSLFWCHPNSNIFELFSAQSTQQPSLSWCHPSSSIFELFSAQSSCSVLCPYCVHIMSLNVPEHRFFRRRAHVVLIILTLCFTSACLGVYTHAHARPQFVLYIADLVGNTIATVGGAIGRPSTCGWKAPYACGCLNDDNDIATMRRILWNQTALELLNAGFGPPKYEKHTNYTFLQVHEAGFEELRRRFAVFFEHQAALNISCEQVVIKVSIFPKMPLSRRRPHALETRIVDSYTGPSGCGIFVLSDWQIAAFQIPQKTNGWNTVAFPTDDFISNLTKIGNEPKVNGLSNEIQRFFNILKIAMVFLVPSSVTKVTFGDWKCNVVGFQQDSARSNRSNSSDFEVLLHGSHFKKSLVEEFVANHGHLVGRQEWAALRDIDRLIRFLGPNATQSVVDMPDIMCTTWHLGRKRQALARFALRWFWFTAAFTMRPQLTYNLAMFDCGESLEVNYFDKSWR